MDLHKNLKSSLLISLELNFKNVSHVPLKINLDTLKDSWICVNTVSYTHLDVYKRQIQYQNKYQCE